MSSPFAITDTLRYVALAVLWTFAGRTLIVAAGQRALGATGWLLAPVAAQAAVALMLGITAAVRAPVHSVATAIWSVMSALAVVGLIDTGRRARTWSSASADVLLVFAAAGSAPLLLMLPCFVYGFGATQVTTHPDAWSYSIFGAYLWEYPRGTEGGLSPAYQWAANLSGTRFVASAQLGWLAPATSEGDTAAAYGLLVAMSSFVMACASAAAGRVLGLSNALLALVAVGSGAGNWMANAVSVSNLDNMLALSSVPALAALALDESPTPFRGRFVICGIISAATLYTYPEFAFVCLGCSALFFVTPLLKQRLAVTLPGVLLGAFVAVILLLPYASEWIGFVSRQLAAGVSTATRPAEFLFTGLLLPLVRPAAIWGLGPEDGAQAPWGPTTAAAIVLYALAFIGFWRLAADRIVAPLAVILILVAGFGLFEYRYEYSYGAYKFLLLSWWLMVIAVALGIRECARVHASLAWAAALIACTMFGSSLDRSLRGSAAPPEPNLAAFRGMRAATGAAAGGAIGVAVMDNVAAHWAAYFLRASKTRLVTSTGYLASPVFQPVIARATPIPWDSVRWLLTDATDPGPIVEEQRWRRVWSNTQMALWDTGGAGWAMVRQIDNGYPYASGGSLVWVGDKPVTVLAAANTSGLATIHATLALSQAAPPSATFRLRASDGTGGQCEWTLPNGGFTLRLGLHVGENVLRLEKTSPIDVPVLPTADQRHPFMVGLAKPTLAFSPGASDASSYCR